MSNLRDQLKSVGKGSAQASAKQDIDMISGIVRRKMSEAGLQSYCKFTVKRRINRDGTYTIWLSFDTQGARRYASQYRLGAAADLRSKGAGRRARTPRKRNSLSGSRSPSFYDGYNGIYSVILPRLLNTGFHTSNYIYGMWHGKKTRSLRDRMGYHFLEEAVEEFNREHSGLSKAIYIKRDAY